MLYWFAQAVYAVVQQWLITGWGAFSEWFPWLPELPEHRRLGYVAPRSPEDMAVQSGDVKKGRFAQWMEKQQELARQKQEEAQQKRDEIAEAQKASRTTSAQGPAKSAKRSDYQSRVDAASKFNKKAAPATAEPVTHPQPAHHRKKKKKA